MSEFHEKFDVRAILADGLDSTGFRSLLTEIELTPSQCARLTGFAPSSISRFRALDKQVRAPRKLLVLLVSYGMLSKANRKLLREAM